MKKTYLGDSVYAEYNGSDLVLTTNNGLNDTNRIVLDPHVLWNLEGYIKQINER
jgi:hypothetical protein